MDPSPLILPPAYRIGPEVFIESINLDFFPWHSQRQKRELKNASGKGMKAKVLCDSRQLTWNITTNLAAKTASIYYLIVSMGQKSGRNIAELGSLLRVFVSRNQCDHRPAFLSGGIGGKSASRLIQAVGRILFNEVVSLRFLFPFWLLVKDHS